jgi:hypothetical protein
MAKDKSEKKQDSSKVWTLMSLGAGILGATVARKTLTSTWRAATGKNPPANPADPDVDLWEAVLWAVASGTAVQVVRMLLSRKAADYYKKSTGHLPPPLQKGDAAEGPTA